MVAPQGNHRGTGLIQQCVQRGELGGAVDDPKPRHLRCEDELMIVDHLVVNRHPWDDDRNHSESIHIHDAASTALQDDDIGCQALIQEILIGQNLMILCTCNRIARAVLYDQ